MAGGAPKRNIFSAKYFNDPTVKKETFFSTHPRQSLKNGGPTLTRILSALTLIYVLQSNKYFNTNKYKGYTSFKMVKDIVVKVLKVIVAF